MGKSTNSMAIFKFANCNSWPGRVSSFHQFYPHFGRCFASEIPGPMSGSDPGTFLISASRRLQKAGTAWISSEMFERFWCLGKWCRNGENHSDSVKNLTSFLHDSSKFFMYSHASRLYLLIFWSSKKMPFFDGPKSPAANTAGTQPGLLPTSEPQNGISWIRRDHLRHPKWGGFLWKKMGVPSGNGWHSYGKSPCY